MYFWKKMLLWVIRSHFEAYEGTGLLDHERMKELAEVWERDKFKQYLTTQENSLARKAGLKTQTNEELWFMRGRIFQVQSLKRNLEKAHEKKKKIEKTLEK